MFKGKLLENFFSLFTLQIFNYLLPFIVLPYLARVLSVEHFGLIFFSLVLMQYINTFVDYGFNVSATRNISINRDNYIEVSKIFFSVFFIKSVFLLLSFLFLIIAVFSFDKFRDNYSIYLISFGFVIGNFLFPVWFFQGIEKMRYITIINVVSRIIFAILVFIFVKSDSDYILVPAFQSLGYITGGLLSLFIIFRYYPLKFILDFSYIKQTLREGFFLFVSLSSSTLIHSTPTFLIGLLLGNSSVAYYASAEKVINAIKSFLMVIHQSFYPHLSHLFNKDYTEYKKRWNLLLKINLAFGFFSILILFFFSKEIVQILYGDKYIEAENILKLLSIFILTQGFVNLLGLQKLVPMGKDKVVALSQLIPGIIFFLTSAIFLYVTKNIYTVLYLLILTDFVVIIIRAFYIKRIKNE